MLVLLVLSMHVDKVQNVADEQKKKKTSNISKVNMDMRKGKVSTIII